MIPALAFGARVLGARRAKPARPSRARRLYVDVSVIFKHDSQTGIQRVVRAVWTNLLEHSGSAYEIVPVFATRFIGYRSARIDFLDVPLDKRGSAWPIDMAEGDIFLGLDLSAHLLPRWRRQVKRWRDNGASINIVVYDLLPFLHPEWFNHAAVENFSRWLSFIEGHCDRVLCISNDVAHQVSTYFKESSPSIDVARLYLAGDINGSLPSRGLDDRILEALDLMKRTPTILMVGTVEPRKGHEAAIAAFEHLWKSEHELALVIAGKPGWKTRELQQNILRHREHGRRLLWLPTVSDEALSLLYDNCIAVLLTSRGEGFGLPAIEAALHGRHALVRDLPVFREQGLSNLCYFSDDSSQALANSIYELLERAAIPPPPSELLSWEICVRLLRETLHIVPDQLHARTAGKPIAVA